MGILEKLSAEHPAASLLRALNTKVMPGIEENLWAHLVIAPAGQGKLRVPPNVEAIPRKRVGRRVATRKRGVWERASMKTARWPSDHLQELRMPKLVFILDGNVGFRLADCVLRCPPGTGIFLPPGAAHTDGSTSHFETISGGTSSCRLLWLTSMISGLNCRICHQDGDVHISALEGEKIFLQNPRLIQLFTLLSDEISDSYNTDNGQTEKYEGRTLNQILYPPIFEGLFRSFMRLIIRDIMVDKFYMSLESVPSADIEIGLDDADPIEQVVQYVRTHFAQPLTIDEMARRFFISRARLTRKFREYTGQSFLEFTNERRLDQARNLLAESEWPASMIGRYVGFRSPAHFHRLFLREQGVSPATYRRQIRKGKASLKISE